MRHWRVEDVSRGSTANGKDAAVRRDRNIQYEVAATAADLFKGPVFGLLYGLVECMIGFAGALGAWSGGYIYDTTQSYRLAFSLAIASSLLSAAFIWVAAPRNSRRPVDEFRI